MRIRRLQKGKTQIGRGEKKPGNEIQTEVHNTLSLAIKPEIKQKRLAWKRDILTFHLPEADSHAATANTRCFCDPCISFPPFVCAFNSTAFFRLYYFSRKNQTVQRRPVWRR